MNLKKFLIVLSCIVLLLLPFNFYVSADEVLGDNFVEVDGENTIYNEDGKDYFYVDYVSYYVERDGEYYEGGTVTSSRTEDGVYRLRLNLNSELGNLRKNDIVDIGIFLKPSSDKFMDPNYNVTGSIKFGMKADASVMSGYDVTRWDGSYSQSAKRDVQNTNWGDYVECTFGDPSAGYSFDSYYIGFQYKVSGYGDSYGRYIYLQDFDFDCVHKDNYTANQIIENQNENTDKILYGGTKYDDVDNSKVYEYEQADRELNQATSSAQSDSISFINNFGNLFQSSHIHNGLLAVSAITKELFSINWVSDILSFGLGLGAFAFILGSSYLIISRTSYNQKEAKYSKERKSSKKGGGV